MTANKSWLFVGLAVVLLTGCMPMPEEPHPQASKDTKREHEADVVMTAVWNVLIAGGVLYLFAEATGQP